MPNRPTPTVDDFIEVLLNWRENRVGRDMTLNFQNGGPSFRMLVQLREGHVAFGVRQRMEGSKKLTGRMFKGKIASDLDHDAFAEEVRRGLSWLASCISVNDDDPEKDVKKSFAHMCELPSLIEHGHWKKPRLDDRPREHRSSRRLAGAH